MKIYNKQFKLDGKVLQHNAPLNRALFGNADKKTRAMPRTEAGLMGLDDPVDTWYTLRYGAARREKPHSHRNQH